MSRRQIFLISSIVSSLFLLGACGGDDSPPGNTGGRSGSGGSSAGGSGGSSGGTTSGGSGGGSACPAIPGDGNITGFSETEGWALNSCQLGSSGCEWEWGNSTSLTGGTIQYTGVEPNPLSATANGEALQLTGTVAATQYAGFGLWFGPACSDASMYTGIEITLSSAVVPQAYELQFQVQMSSNYPTDTENSRGECPFSSEDVKWSECTNNYFVVEEVGDVAAPIQIPFASFTGGLPVATLDPTELMGIQLQFNCGNADCPVDLTIDSIRFY